MSLNSYEIRAFRDSDRQQILAIWENSVLATHAFLTRSDFEEIKELVRSLDFNELQVFCLTDEHQVLGFIGVADSKIEMLFLDPGYFGRGLGKKLMSFAVNELNADKLDVNEQNVNALEFYKKFGFVAFERTEKDDQGRPYPLVKMKLVNNTR